MATCVTALEFVRPNDFPARAEPAAHPDDALVEAAKTGDARAFAQLIERYQRFCLAKAYSILRNRYDAEDEVQSAWGQAWTHLSSYEGQGSFCAWLRRIVSNQCLMRLRNAKLMPMTSVDQVFESEGSFRLEVIDQRASPEDVVGDEEVARVVADEISRVPRLLREVLVMRDVHSVPMADIAAHLGISIPATKSRLMRARLELRQRLVKHHGDKGGGTLLQKAGWRRTAYVQAG